MLKTINLPALFRVYSYPKNSSYYKYELIIYNASFSRKINDMRNNKDVRVKILRCKDGYILKRSANNGNIIYSIPEKQNSRIFIANIFSAKEKNKLKKKIKNSYFKTRTVVKIYPQEWQLSISDLFLESKETQLLATELMKRGYKVIPVTHNNPKKLELAIADILICYKNKKIPIEITRHIPCISKQVPAGVNAPHGHIWLKVLGRIFPIFLYCTSNNLPGFVIINEKWKKYKHPNFYCNELKKYKCFILFSSFKDDWFNEIIKEIDRIIKGG